MVMVVMVVMVVMMVMMVVVMMMVVMVVMMVVVVMMVMMVVMMVVTVAVGRRMRAANSYRLIVRGLVKSTPSRGPHSSPSPQQPGLRRTTRWPGPSSGAHPALTSLRSGHWLWRNRGL